MSENRRLTAAELHAELASDGIPRSVVHCEATIRLGLHDVAQVPAVYARLGRGLDAALRGFDDVAARPRAMQVVSGLLRLCHRFAPAERATAAARIDALATRLDGGPAALAHAAALLVDGRATSLAAESATDPLLARHGAQAFLWLSTVPPGAAQLFTIWIRELERAMPYSGSTAFRAFLGDVAEAAFRAVSHGDAGVLGDDGSAFLVDACCAELGGTTDFIAARAMTWLIGALAHDDDTAHAAVERAQSRFRDPAFQADCASILAEDRKWP